LNSVCKHGGVIKTPKGCGVGRYRPTAKSTKDLSTLTTDAAGKLDVLWHDGDTLGVDGAQVGVLKQADEVSLGGFLESQDSGALETEIGLEVLSNLTDQALEWELADQELSRLLVLSDLTESNSTWPVSVWLLDTTSGWGALAGGCGEKEGRGTGMG
jgi:hypothetical protein